MTPRTAARQASLSITNSRSLLKLVSIESVMPSNHLILCRPFLLPPPILPSTRVLSNESVLHIRWPKHWSNIHGIDFTTLSGLESTVQQLSTHCGFTIIVSLFPNGNSAHLILIPQPSPEDALSALWSTLGTSHSGPSIFSP